MSGLYPTPTRLALLRDCADGLVTRNDLDGEWYLYGRRVTASVGVQITAGWLVAEGVFARPTRKGRGVLEGSEHR